MNDTMLPLGIRRTSSKNLKPTHLPFIFHYPTIRLPAKFLFISLLDLCCGSSVSYSVSHCVKMCFFFFYKIMLGECKLVVPSLDRKKNSICTCSGKWRHVVSGTGCGDHVCQSGRRSLLGVLLHNFPLYFFFRK
jgi:hypothetical protein